MTKRAATRCGPNSIRATSQAHPAGQEGLAYTLGGRILQAASSVGCTVEGFSDPRGYFIGEILHAGYEQNRRPSAGGRQGKRRRGVSRLPAEPDVRNVTFARGGTMPQPVPELD